MPTIAVVTGEGGSGGALALAMANRVLMLEHAVYSVLSPEGFASILWKDASRVRWPITVTGRPWNRAMPPRMLGSSPQRRSPRCSKNSEPGALIGFAGPRVIEQTIKEQLPEGFQHRRGGPPAAQKSR